MTYAAPGATVRIHPDNQHTSKVFRLGKVNDQGRIQIVGCNIDADHSIGFKGNSRATSDAYWPRRKSSAPLSKLLCAALSPILVDQLHP